MSLGDSSESKVPGKCGENVDLSNSKGCFLTASEGGGASSHIDCSTYPRDKNDINNTQTASLLDAFKRHTQKLTKSRRSSSTLSASFEAGEEKVILRKSQVLTEADADQNIDKMPKSTQTDKCEKLCGWLNKLGHRAIVKTYKSRWFVYGDNTCKLYYYRTPQDLLPLGEIDIHNASFSFDISNTAGPGQFQISSGGREYYLDATNRQTMLYWLEELQSKRRHFSNKRTSLSKTRVSVLSANQKSIAEGLLGKRKSLGDHSDTDPTHGNHETSSDILIGQNSISIQQAGSSFTNLSLTNLRTEIRNYVAGLRSPNSSPSGYSDKSAVEDWTVVDPESSPSLSPKSAPTVGQAPPTEAQTKLNNKFSFSNLRKILKKGNEDIEISAPSCNTLEPCQRCGQFKAYLSSLKEELTSVEEELAANREVTRLLQKEIDKLQAEVLSKQALDALDGATPEQLLKQRDDKIVDLEYLLTKTQEEKEMVRQQVREQGNVIGTQRDQVTMLQDMLTAKDDVIINLTNQLDALEKGHRSASDPTSVTTSPPVLRVFTDATEVERLKDSCDAYEMQNKFLSREILALNELRDNDEQREKLLQMQYANMEAKFYQTRSKYLFLLNELKEPVRGGSQDVIDQLLSEVLEADDETTVDLLNSQNSTIEYDRYGFLKTFETEEDILVTMATEMQRRSKELEIQIKEVDQSGVSHQVKWENFIVSLGERALEKSDEVKALVRGGIPHQHRETIWKACVNLRIQPKGSNYYEDLVKMSEKNKHNPAAKQIELDLLRTLPNNKYYESFESDGIPKLRRVLLAYSWHNPDIGYCQGLNRLVAIALLFLKEEDAFWCLMAIVESIMPPEYYTRTLMAAQADQRVLKDLLQQKLPRLHSHLEAHEVDLSLFTFNWFLTIFVDNIPPELFLRVWDSFLYEGNKVLFRFALAFFKYREEEILQQTTAININKYLRVIGQKMTDVRRLAEIAFTELNPFPARVITNRRHYHMIQVKAQLKQLDALREDFHSHIVPADRLEYYSDDDIDSDDKGGKLSPKEVPVTMTPASDAAVLE